MKTKKTKLQRAVGAMRMLFGFCPECNSDAPELGTCKVCEGYHATSIGYTFPPIPETKDRWKRRFLMARCIHGFPMEDTDCPECVAMFRAFAYYRRNPGNPRAGND